MKRSSLKRKTPLRAKKPMSRGTKGLRRTRLKQKSDKRKKQDQIYFARRDNFLKVYPICQFKGCEAKSRDVHHKAGRTGTNYLDVTTWMAICRRHHNWIHDNPNVARMFDLLTPR